MTDILTQKEIYSTDFFQKEAHFFFLKKTNLKAYIQQEGIVRE